MKKESDTQRLIFQRASIPAMLKKSVFIKNTLLVMTGTAAGQLIGVVLTPIISRLYSPSDFGVFGSFIALSNIIAAGTTLDYSQAMMLPKEKENAINLLAISFVCTFAMGFLCMLICLIIPKTVNGIMKTEGAWPLILLVIATIVAGANKSCQAWSVRIKAFKYTSASEVIRSITSNGTRIGFGVIRIGATGLIISNILAYLLASINLLHVMLRDIRTLRADVQWARMKRLANEYRDFPMYSASQNVVNTMSSGLPVLLLTQYYGISVAGAYAFGISVMQVPMSFILTALSQVLFQKASETQHQGGSLSALYVKSTASLLAITLLPSLIIIIWAPKLFTLIFGPQWYMAGELARSLIIWLAFAFSNVPAVLFAKIIRMQRFVFFYDLILLMLRITTLVLGGMYLNKYRTVMLFALVSAAMNIILIYRVGQVLNKKEGPLNLNVIRNLKMQQ